MTLNTGHRPLLIGWLKDHQQASVLWSGLVATVERFDQTPDIDSLNRAARAQSIVNACGQPIVFTEQQAACGQRAYEQTIYAQGEVPTRAGHWHDVFNACVWLTYPNTKAALNAVHQRQPASTKRTPASDAATVFDESGAILIGPDPRLAHWLKQHDWQSAFVTHRHLWATHHLLVVGHAILEKLANPYPGMIAKVLYQPWPALSDARMKRPPAGLDALVAQRWQQDEFDRPAALFPVPVLGVPGADPANDDPTYYNNTEVFRPQRPKRLG